MSDWSDTHYIIARSDETAAYWWYTELGGEPIPKEVEIKEVDPETIIRCGIEDVDNLSDEDRNNYLHAIVMLDEWKLENDCIRVKVGKPLTLGDLSKYKQAEIRLYIEKPAKLYLEEAIKNQYPMPCCFCTTAG